MKVLIADKMSPLAEEVFANNNVAYDVKTGLKPEELMEIIGDYAGLAMRSSTNITQEILAKAPNLKVIARAGIGVDNVDIEAATNNGTIVMNTPFGNTITTAEHAIAMMFAIARKIPKANSSTQLGKWEKSKFMGVEITGKTLGVIGAGNIGSIVIKKALGLGMKVIAFDPFLSEEKASQLGVVKKELGELLSLSDFITLHVPLLDATRNIIAKEALAKMKSTAYLINCARGGLVNEEDLREALDNGVIAGAAFDVFVKEPARENILFGSDKIICTPHLGASTIEAQDNVAIQAAEQIANFLNNGVVENSLNIPAISLEDAKFLNPYLALGDDLGGFLGNLADSPIKKIKITYTGGVTELNTKPITSTIIKSILSSQISGINIVNSKAVAQKRAIEIEDILSSKKSNYNSSISINIITEKEELSIVGTLFAGFSRIVKINGVRLEAEINNKILYLENQDKPGLIGEVGKFLGDMQVNIANFHLGRNYQDSGNAIALISIDGDLNDDSLSKISKMDSVIKVKLLNL